MSTIIDLDQLVRRARTISFALGLPEEMIMDLSHTMSVREVGPS